MALLDIPPETLAFIIFIMGMLSIYTGGAGFSDNAVWGSLALLWIVPSTLVGAVFTASPLLGPVAFVGFLFYYTRMSKYVGESISVCCVLAAIVIYLHA